MGTWAGAELLMEGCAAMAAVAQQDLIALGIIRLLAYNASLRLLTAHLMARFGLVGRGLWQRLPERRGAEFDTLDSCRGRADGPSTRLLLLPLVTLHAHLNPKLS